MNQFAGNGLTLSELEQIEESAQHSKTSEAKTVLRLSAALREALQAKENACALAAEFKKKADAGHRNSGKLFKFSRAP
jgi:indole-3-glycerol phosphate synthase